MGNEHVCVCVRFTSWEIITQSATIMMMCYITACLFFFCLSDCAVHTKMFTSLILFLMSYQWKYLIKEFEPYDSHFEDFFIFIFFPKCMNFFSLASRWSDLRDFSIFMDFCLCVNLSIFCDALQSCNLHNHQNELKSDGIKTLKPLFLMWFHFPNFNFIIFKDY